MELVQTAMGRSQGVKAVKGCMARHSLLYQYIDYTEGGVCAEMGLLVGKENVFWEMGKITEGAGRCS